MAREDSDVLPISDDECRGHGRRLGKLEDRMTRVEERMSDLRESSRANGEKLDALRMETAASRGRSAGFAAIASIIGSALAVGLVELILRGGGK